MTAARSDGNGQRPRRTPVAIVRSWLNAAECELSVLTRQCLGRRIAETETVRSEAAAWTADRNARQTGVDWQFTTEQARVKLKSLYPQPIL